MIGLSLIVILFLTAVGAGLSAVLNGVLKFMFALASGIGRATATAYARSGVKGICLADISSSGLSETLLECSDKQNN